MYGWKAGIIRLLETTRRPRHFPAMIRKPVPLRQQIKEGNTPALLKKAPPDRRGLF